MSSSREPEWPEPSGGSELYKARLAWAATAASAEQAAADGLAAAQAAANLTNYLALCDGIATAALASIDRARASAETVQKAAAAIGTIYAGILALVYAADKTTMPLRGVVAPVFLGAAIVLSTLYVSYLGPTEGTVPWPKGSGTVRVEAEKRLRFTIRWANELTLRRAWALRCSVVSLGFGVVYIVLPFVTLHPQAGAPGGAGDPMFWGPLLIGGVGVTLGRGRRMEPKQSPAGGTEVRP